MTDVLTSDEFDAMFDSGNEMDDLLEWDEAFHDTVGNGDADVAVRVCLPQAVLDAVRRKAAERGQTKSEFVAEAIGAAIASA